MRHAALLLICLVGLLTGAMAPATADKRVALVIGNAAYQHVQHLPNPLNDAADLAATLQAIGFNVRQANDLGRAGMVQELASFSDEAAGADIALVFFAGHGMEVERQNYLIPVDAKLETDRRIRFETVSLDDVMASLDGVKGIRIVLLDACRNNPFATSMKVTSSARSVGRGLSRIEAPRGTLISFSAKEGTVAADGKGRNSPYTASLIDNLKQPGLEISLLFRKVRDDVLGATGDAQEPFVSSSLSSESVYLVPPTDKVEPAPVALPQQPQPHPQQQDLAAQVWAVTKDTESAEILKAYISRFKGTVYAELANARLKEVEDAAAKAKASGPPLPKPKPEKTEQQPVEKSQTGKNTGQAFMQARIACAGDSLAGCEKACSMGGKRACIKVRCLKGNRASCRFLRNTKP